VGAGLAGIPVKTGPKPVPAATRILRRAVRDPATGCLVFTGSKNRAGYGQIGSGVIRGRPIGAHVAIWEARRGPVPPGHYVCHSCDNPPCVEYEHLFLGTPKQNSADRDRKGRGRPGHVPGVRNGRAKLTDADIVAIRKLHAAGGITQAALGRQYGVSQAMIGYIVRRKSWKHILT